MVTRRHPKSTTGKQHAKLSSGFCIYLEMRRVNMKMSLRSAQQELSTHVNPRRHTGSCYPWCAANMANRSRVFTLGFALLWKRNLDCGKDPAQALPTQAWVHSGRTHSQEVRQESSPSSSSSVFSSGSQRASSLTILSCLAWPVLTLPNAKLGEKRSRKEGAKKSGTPPLPKPVRREVPCKGSRCCGG